MTIGCARTTATSGCSPRLRRVRLAWTAAALLCATAGVARAELPNLPNLPKAPLALVLVGDSTMATGTGYGDALCHRVAAGAACLNLARGGRSTRSYRAEGLWEQALAQLHAYPAGTAIYVLIQFGHNDQPGKPGRSTDLNREYPANLATFVAEVRAAGGKPVLVTPLTRRSFTKAGALIDDLRPWALAMREVARRQQVPLVDLYGRSATAVQVMGPALSKQMAVAHEGKPGFDTAHLGAKGACVFSDMVWHGLVAQEPAWGAQADPAPDCAQVPAP